MRVLFHLIRLMAWRTLTRDRVRSFVTVLGVALGVAVALAIRLANDGVLDSFRNSLDHVAGKSRLQVSAGEAGLDETLFPVIAGAPGVARAVAIVQTVMPVAGQDHEVLLVLGVDVLADASVREYRGGAPDLADPLQLLTDPDAILLTERFARAHTLRPGDRIRLLTPTGPKAFVIRGLLADQGTARAMDGQLAVMDIAAAQLQFGKLGRLDRVDLLLEEGAEPDRVASVLRERLPPEAAVERPDARNAQVEQMLASFQLNLFVLSLIALFVGMFLVYNTVSVSVVRQRRQLGILRALGASRSSILVVVGAEGALIGLTGSLLGVFLGAALARETTRAVSQTVSSLYAFVRPGEVHLPATLTALAILLGCGIAILSSLLPALEAAAVTPREGMATGLLERRHRPWLLARLALGLALLSYGLAQVGPVGRRPLFGYGAALSLLLAATLLCPGSLRAFQRLLAACLAGSTLLTARVAAGNLGRALRRNAVTIGAMVVGLAMLVSVSTMVQSFRSTVEVWIQQTIRGDLYVSRATRLIKGADLRLPLGVLEKVRGIPGVADADGFRGIRVEDGAGGRFLLGAGDFDVMARRGRLLFRRGDSAAILSEARLHDRLIVSETFAERYHLREGDEVTLHPPGRTIRLPIAGVYYDYTTEGGLAVMDRGLFERLWRDPWLSSIILYLSPGADPRSVRQEILRRHGLREDLVIFTNRDLKTRILEIFDQTFAITYALEIIALVVASLSVLNTLLASVLERTREIGILRSVGFTRGAVVRTILCEATFMGVLANLLGAFTGLGLSLILIYVINKQSFGWTIQFSVPILLIVEYAILTLAASLAAGSFPAWRASRLPIAEAVRYE
ncbi:MAG TPA: FtsX-like permease family protein [Candidatus Methylomirabilis sp.]|nr:FtsX-like permease family protein [Candidatus Methylomirabilis sp.]